MKGIFWNSRGLSDLAKYRFLSDLSREQKLDLIALLETGKKDFSKTVLDNICGGQEFIWRWSEPHGRSGGILLGINLDFFDIGSIDEGDFYVKFCVRNKVNGFYWVLIAVYEAAQAEHKESFLTELAQTCTKESDPILVGGDFNIIRSPQEKNNDRYDDRWPFLFNAIIDSLDLRELDLSNRKYTWAKSRDTPIFERLDRILVSTEWESKFPLATVQALTREISDHTPLLLDTGNGTHGNKQPGFKFELSWLLRDDFNELVARI